MRAKLLQAKIIQGDCLDVMAGMPEASIDAIVTDPPYGLSFMGKDWDKGVPGEAFWREALRIAKPGCHILAAGGSRTYHRLAVAIEDAGWEIRDCVMWIYGSGFPKSHNLKDDWQGWGTALKPAFEPFILARKPLDGTVAANVQRHGCGGLNVDGCRVRWSSEKDAAAAAAAAVGFAKSLAAGRVKQSNSIGKESRCGKNTYFPEHLTGRWPANVIHDGSDETTHLFGSAARFFYCAKASRSEREAGLDGMIVKPVHRYRAGIGEGIDPNAPARNRNHHPTVKPVELMAYLCRLITPPDGMILDPFCGSGSTGVAAMREGFNFTGIELNPEYVEIAKRRISHEREKAALLA